MDLPQNKVLTNEGDIYCPSVCRDVQAQLKLILVQSSLTLILLAYLVNLWKVKQKAASGNDSLGP